MALLGAAALAMWWDMAADARQEFEDWHSHEHFPERLAIPGFLRASRWVSAEGGEGIFVMYELAGHEVLGSAPYLARLNAPTPWSTRMMPRHRNMVRSQCRVLASRGGAVAAHAVTARLVPGAGGVTGLRARLEALIDSTFDRPGVVGVHLLEHEPPAIATTTEQRIRGQDGHADLVLVACGYDMTVLHDRVARALDEAASAVPGATLQAQVASHTLSHSATPLDVA